ncbi:MAG TPA: sigma-70 family RNA polymerase sigma factor [Chthonomonadaceae bacterium]|nr:sigma-70 family RNA polymerase sigma factor [Chthonomonadaceae bacterium]
MDEAQALEAFTGPDEDRARTAYGSLCESGRRFLRAYLRDRLRYRCDSQELIEDAIQDAFVKIWRLRAGFADQGVAAWYAYLKRVADSCCADLLRGRKPDIPLPVFREEEAPRSDPDPLDEILEALMAALQAGQLAHQADILWLELDPALSEDTHVRQLLAAQLVYLDGAPWQEAVDVLGAPAPGEDPLTRETLDAWLAHHGVLRYLAYSELYYANDRLAGALLGWDEEVPSGALDEVMRQALSPTPSEVAPGGWAWPEVAVILWRYRNALLVEQIVQRSDCPLTRQEIINLLVRTGANLPFGKKMADLLAALARAPGVRAREALGAPGLWKRLAFQYCYTDDLPHRDIQERTQPAAERAGYTVTLAALNGWLSQGRLIRQLARHVADILEGDGDA